MRAEVGLRPWSAKWLLSHSSSTFHDKEPTKQVDEALSSALAFFAGASTAGAAASSALRFLVGFSSSSSLSESEESEESDESEESEESLESAFLTSLS